MLLEVSVVEQRYQAVSAVLHHGATIVEVAERFGVARQTVHVWINRYAAGGIDALKEKSHRPHGCPHQMPPVAEARVLELRRVHPTWGAASPGAPAGS